MIARLLSVLRYHPKLSQVTHRLQRRDDFRWQTYTQDDYKQRLESASQQETRQLAKVQWEIQDDTVLLGEGTNPLNPSHRLMYETVLRLNPAVLCEFGFGGGDHLANLGLLLPAAPLIGFEISEAQLMFARQRNSLHNAQLLVRDMTLPGAADDIHDAADLVYCNAVMMHIHGKNRHVTFLHNMLRVSRRYVLFTENWLRHNFANDVRSLGQVPLLVRNETHCAVLIDKLNQSELPELSDCDLRRFGF